MSSIAVKQQYEREIVEVWSDPFFFDQDDWDSWRKEEVNTLIENEVEPSVFLSLEEDPQELGVVIARMTYPEEKITQFIHDDVCDLLETELENLNKDVPEEIYAFGTVERWNGLCCGASPLGSCNLSSCLKYDGGGDFNRFYIKGEDLKQESAHHDGTNHITFRMLNPRLTDDERDDFETYLSMGETHRAYELTVPIGDYVREFYGTW